MFKPFPKIPRMDSEMTVTEKIDGTNGCIIVRVDEPENEPVVAAGQGFYLQAGSRNRLLSLDSDNFGFARFVQENAQQIVDDIGEGVHYGEWWGSGIQRGYGMKGRVFSLFNTARFGDIISAVSDGVIRTVPILFHGIFETAAIHKVGIDLMYEGSRAAPGWMKPEGVMVFHHRLNGYMKYPMDK